MITEIGVLRFEFAKPRRHMSTTFFNMLLACALLVMLEPEASAYHPKSHEACDACLNSCLTTFTICSAGALAFPPLLLGCVKTSWLCAGACSVGACCPKRCEVDADLAGGGCCDADEQCVDKSDPNSRSGCCPSDQMVCSGQCCPLGSTCCGGLCCDALFCIDGFCTDYVPFPTTPPAPDAPTESDCSVPGATPCQRPWGEWLCCAPDMVCCAGWCGPFCIT
jgi:hypothetical protein